KWWFAVGLTVLTWLPVHTKARDFRPSQMPNGNVFGCATCHINPGGGGPRNPFGLAVQAIVRPGLPDRFWTEELAVLDSDNDGFTNGEEVGDPDGDNIAEPDH